jgi:hypothetical protein
VLRSLDQDVDGEDGQGILRELERFKSCLSVMFARDGRGVAFMETAIHAGLKSDDGTAGGSGSYQRVSKHHTIIDVIPFEQGMQSEISMFFRQVPPLLSFSSHSLYHRHFNPLEKSGRLTRLASSRSTSSILYKKSSPAAFLTSLWSGP